MNEITKNLMCVVIRGGLEVWIDDDKVDNLMIVIEKNSVVKIDNNVINTKDIVGIFTPEVMKGRDTRKRGDWQCDYGRTHQKYEKCPCVNSLGYK
jgi:ribosomal protein L19E